MVGYEGEPWQTRPDGENPWPIGPAEEEELSFADPEGWVDPGLEEARLGWVTEPKSGRTGPTTRRPTGQFGIGRAGLNRTGSGHPPANNSWGASGRGLGKGQE
ncbi:unnamed protein product [Linum trigynum]|uniref:Uncharacterized protein n=1 Tax=Linum trigynum TaxID=586398 RepID=A0AAV2CB01_9ROSI